MKSRRSFLRVVACAAVALTVAIAPALADELIGRITKVDVEGKKVVVTETGTDKDVEVAVTDDTIFSTPKGDRKVELEKLQQRVEKSKKGIAVEVTHDKGVASKIKVVAKKKAEN